MDYEFNFNVFGTLRFNCKGKSYEEAHAKAEEMLKEWFAEKCYFSDPDYEEMDYYVDAE